METYGYIWDGEERARSGREVDADSPCFLVRVPSRVFVFCFSNLLLGSSENCEEPGGAMLTELCFRTRRCHKVAIILSPFILPVEGRTENPQNTVVSYRMCDRLYRNYYHTVFPISHHPLHPPGPVSAILTPPQTTLDGDASLQCRPTMASSSAFALNVNGDEAPRLLFPPNSKSSASIAVAPVVKTLRRHPFAH